MMNILKRKKLITVRRCLHIFTAIAVVLSLLLCMPAAQVYADSESKTPAFTEEEQNYISSQGTLKVGFVQDRIPVSFPDDDGNADGISRYIFDRISEISGLKFEYVALPTGNVTYDYLQSEGFDLVTSVEYNEENKKARGILISKPYLSSRKVVVAKGNLEFSTDKHFTVAVSTGSQTLKKVLANMFPNFELKDYPSISDCFDAVYSGEADLMIQNQYVVEYWMAKPKYEKLKVIPVVGLDDQMCFSAVVELDGKGGMSQEDGQILIDILDKTIDCLSEDEIGSYIIQGVMENQYNYTFSDFLNKYRYAVAILFISLLIIIVLVILLTRQRIHYAESKAEAKAKGRFLSTMSHEIRTPLNGLIGLNYLMTQRLDNKDKMQEYLRQSSITANYLLSLVNDILDSSKLEAQKLDLIIRPVDLELVTETVTSIERTAMSDKHLNYSVTGELPYRYILGDEIRIQQVLLNLLDNARKFTSENGSITLDMKQQLTDGGKVLTTITVTDTGKGMSEEFQKNVFDLFAQELETVSKGNQGTGLGLPISRRLARLMGGDLICESKKGVGSKFTFTFIAEQTDPIVRTVNADASENHERPRILVAEDNELNGEIILELLQNDGFEADIAVDGKQAFEMFRDSPTGTYGVILMDLLMPEMDGFETTKAIRALNRDDAKTVRIFACTANSLSEERERAFECGMNDFISKPVNIEELLKKLYI